MQVRCLFFILFAPLNMVLLRSESAFLQLTVIELFVVLWHPMSPYAASLTILCLHFSRPHPVSPLFKASPIIPYLLQRISI